MRRKNEQQGGEDSVLKRISACSNVFSFGCPRLVPDRFRGDSGMHIWDKVDTDAGYPLTILGFPLVCHSDVAVLLEMKM